MKDLKLESGDVVIENNDLSIIEGNELTAQTIKQVLSTNTGEWLFDSEEGVNFDNIFADRVRMEAPTGISDDEYRASKQNEGEYTKLADKLARRLDGES